MVRATPNRHQSRCPTPPANRSRAALARSLATLALALSWAITGEAAAQSQDTSWTAPGVAVRFDAAQGALVYRACKATMPVCPPANEARVGLPGEFANGAATGRVVEIGDGSRLVYVTVTARSVSDSPAQAPRFEALFAPGLEAPLFASVAPPSAAAKQMMMMVPQDQASGSGKSKREVVVLGEVASPGARICGQPYTLTDPRVVLPKSFALARAAVQRLDRGRRDAATPLTASLVGTAGPDAQAPRAQLLRATGASEGLAEVLADGDARTTWSESRTGDGRGEFVTFEAPHDMDLEGVQLRLAADPSRSVVLPKNVYVATEKQVFAVALPDGPDALARPNDGVVTVRFPAPLRSACISVVLAETPSETPVTVGFGEVLALTRYDALSAANVLGLLDASGAEATSAADYLRHGTRTLFAEAAEVYPKLTEVGRARALTAALEREGCTDQAPLLFAAMAGRDRALGQRASGKFERCGKRAEQPLIEGLSGPARAQAASLLALLSPRAAVRALPPFLGHAEDRGQVRQALTRALRVTGDMPLEPQLEAHQGKPYFAEWLRAAAQRLPERAGLAFPFVSAPLNDSQASFDAQYAQLDGLMALARAGHGPSLTLARRLVLDHREAALRARIVELALPPDDNEMRFEDLVQAALRDAHPRVRALATQRLRSPSATPRLLPLLNDPWTFVRHDVTRTLSRLPANRDVDAAFAKVAMEDPSADARALAVEGIGRHRALAQQNTLRDVLETQDEEVFVRAAATRALGMVCSLAALDQLTDLAKDASKPGASATSVALGLAALEALGLIHPPDLARRIAPALSSKGPVAQAARDAAKPGAARCAIHP